jgi:hypothetical protein
MKPLLLNFQEESKTLGGTFSTGTNTFTKARENHDEDYEYANLSMRRKTITNTRENMDEAPFWA